MTYEAFRNPEFVNNRLIIDYMNGKYKLYKTVSEYFGDENLQNID